MKQYTLPAYHNYHGNVIQVRIISHLYNDQDSFGEDFQPPPVEEIESLEANDDLIKDSKLSGDSLDSSDDSSDDEVSELRYPLKIRLTKFKILFVGDRVMTMPYIRR